MAINPTSLWRVGAITVASGMITGAFGAHAIKSRVTPDRLDVWKTASNYAIVNGLALLAISMHPRFAVHRFAGPAIAGGSAVFSGSIFTLVLKPEWKIFGPITPLAGTVMIAGYVALAL
ncbi:hypothetical protein FRB94_009618 [Tulasnella sp. JGI-2019a]|nr:hypothetical protein FRB94_009618 [Tulasnella sp. JGI-2019a]KAG9017758.1 hypothetical protein FRB93_004569 [Tulasnella sp. JGI-2019a]KAG9035827.1 hypothetical protein FRB95_010421 [Tulasnella sp. JGI-2019a]